MPTLEGVGAREVAEPPLFRDPQTELGVLADAERLVEEADIAEDRAADDNRGRHDRRVMHEVLAKLACAFGVEAAHRDDAAVRRVIAAELDEIAVHEADLPLRAKAGSWRSSFSGVQKSSPSRKAMNWPRASRTARLRAPDCPSPGVSMILRFAISRASRSSTTPDASREPSLTTMISSTTSNASGLRHSARPVRSCALRHGT